jgi:1-acyl-sn-glycerol-3-phosphate acyltransferase
LQQQHAETYDGHPYLLPHVFGGATITGLDYQVRRSMKLVKGVVAIVFITLNTARVWVVLPFWLLQRTWTRGAALSRLKRRMDRVMWWWTKSNRWMIEKLGLTETHVNWIDREEVSPDNWYLVICNHQSWTDILLLQSYLYGTLAPLKFFTKQELIWVPGVGLAMYVLGFPYVKRVTKDQIKANPKLKNADRDSIARACEGFKNHPTCILNFVEGTRRTPEKQQRQNSNYEHLLRPKIGGIEYVIADMHDYLHRLVDVTIVYPQGVPTFWDFLQGKCESVHFEVRQHEIPDAVNVANDAERRSALAGWVRELWNAKDQRIKEILRDAA